MKRFWMVVVTMAVFAGCDSQDASDPGSDSGRDVPVVTDGGTDPGTPSDPGQPVDPGVTPDPGRPDPGVQDPGSNPDPGGTDVPACPPALGGSACHEIAACALQCDDPSFQEDCIVDPVPGATDAWNALKSCLEQAECNPAFQNEQYSPCVLNACRSELNQCAASPGGTCRDIWRCRKDCDPDDVACPARCFGLGTEEAQDLWIAYKDCILGVECAATDINANGWPTWTCEAYGQNHNCPIQAQACFPPTT